INEAKELLNIWVEHNHRMIEAIVGFFPATANKQTLFIQEKAIPVLRQQEKREDNQYKSVADFVNPQGDYIGMFSVAVHPLEKHCDCCLPEDAYQEMLAQIVRDRLAEAATEYVHLIVKQSYWPGAKGIRPAAGYPMLPDISLNFIIDDFLQMKRIGMKLTPNAAIYPTSSTAGFFFAHPESVYFYIGKVGEDQLINYASRKNTPIEETKRWLGI
ncbi:methionine synthase, partial [Bacteroidales bacterium OttesenSCG-928-M11]|nr:methionine synthase [Bacteroidales bacterium OttesenSCG-928-M11]